MKIVVTSVLVDDQEKALRFYTGVLGFVRKRDGPLGAARWLTVVSPKAPDGTELLLEPDGHPAAGPFKRALVEDGIPFTSFAVDDVRAEFERLRALGVRLVQEPVAMGAVTRPSSTTPAATSSRSTPKPSPYPTGTGCPVPVPGHKGAAARGVPLDRPYAKVHKSWSTRARG
jgi:catechol 2,3-dioxygenase-like lactoylglutathione lyase family enzyme